MPVETIYALGASQITVSGGEQLSGITQGDGSHLDGETITLDSNSWEAVLVDDNDSDFSDNDGSQRLEGAQIFDGISYSDNIRVEAEFSITVQDPDGNTFELLAFNLNEGGGSSFATVEGLAFVGDVGGFPPIGVPLTVTATGEGPSEGYAELATPPCFTPGCLIETPSGPVDIDQLKVGDLVNTLDHGPQPIAWIGQTRLPGAVLNNRPEFCPVRIAKGAFGPNCPSREIRLSPQHRILISDWRAEFYFGESELLVPIKKLINDGDVIVDHAASEVCYIHLMFEDHQIVFSDGLASESYFPKLNDSDETGNEIRALFSDIAAPDTEPLPVRPGISDKSAGVLRS